MVKYFFKNIANGQICEGHIVIQIVNHEAVISDEAEMLLAEKNGGELAPKKAKTEETK